MYRNRFHHPFGAEGNINKPSLVPLKIRMRIGVSPDHIPGEVRTSLLEAFGNQVLPGGTKGFFHIGNFTSGQHISSSQILAVAMSIEGVRSAEVLEFRRLDTSGRENRGETLIVVGPSEIIQLENDSLRPEKGTIEFLMEKSIEGCKP